MTAWQTAALLETETCHLLKKIVKAPFGGATGACTFLVFHILYIVCAQMLGRDYTSFPLLSFLIVLAPCLLQTREERAGQMYKLLKVTAGN